MNKTLNKYLLVLTVATLIFVTACQQPGGDSTGSEYMPDMAHSIAYEANYYNYYYNNTWGSEDDYYEFAKPKKPVDGTIARGYVGLSNAADKEALEKMMKTMTGEGSVSGKSVTPNGSVPYYYDDTEEERTRAMNEIIDNPYPITDAGIAGSKELYNIYCGICHGDKGDGSGYLVRDPNPATGDAGGVYPVQPANFLLDEFVAASNGRYYHSIMYGKNLMGSYADKLSFEERWQVIHYIRSLQAKALKLEYNQLTNTLNNVDVPAGEEIVEEAHSDENQELGSQHSDEEDQEAEHH
jgi:mono/diheme cytochrome c family protein